MYKVTTDGIEGKAPEITQSLDELAREGARRMILAALELEEEQHVQELHHLRDELDHATVVRNGKARERTVQLGAGAIKLRAPRVNDRRPDHRFTSKILPPYMRRSPRLEEALPVLYLRGLSTGDFTEALGMLLGPEAAGFSASTIMRLLKVWQDDYQAWRKRSLNGKEYICVWAGGVYFNVRLEEDRLACLAMAFKLLTGAEKRWRRLNAPHLVALVKAGAKFPDGQAKMLQLEKADDRILFSQAPSVFAANETSVHNI